jgi:hemin uptake protein HemP
MTAHPRLQEMAERPRVDPSPVWNARDLVREGRSATIVLDGQAYNLRITRAGKLILTK